MGLTADLIVAQQQHEPPAGAHFVLLAGVVVTALAVLGVRWWRGRRDPPADRHSHTDDRSPESRRSPEDE